MKLVTPFAGYDEHEGGQAGNAHFFRQLGKSQAVSRARLGAASWGVRVPFADVERSILESLSNHVQGRSVRAADQAELVSCGSHE